ncbi:MAG: hypothetical protein IKN42_00925 [Elusimicrobia bacterium]|nr:hypothetical protein [Elusimicrobiota bacterium]
MSIQIDEWCTERAAEIMEEKYGKDWIHTCPDDAYEEAIAQAGFEFPTNDYDEDEELDKFLKWYDSSGDV